MGGAEEMAIVCGWVHALDMNAQRCKLLHVCVCVWSHF